MAGCSTTTPPLIKPLARKCWSQRSRLGVFSVETTVDERPQRGDRHEPPVATFDGPDRTLVEQPVQRGPADAKQLGRPARAHGERLRAHGASSSDSRRRRAPRRSAASCLGHRSPFSHRMYVDGFVPRLRAMSPNERPCLVRSSFARPDRKSRRTRATSTASGVRMPLWYSHGVAMAGY
jgi:hypothetical protein